jgi:hypothetical protein
MDTEIYKEIYLFIDKAPSNWQSIFDSTLDGALKPVLSFNKTEKTGPYLSSIMEISVTFLHNSTHFHFFLYSACFSPFLPLFLPSFLSSFLPSILSSFPLYSYIPFFFSTYFYDLLYIPFSAFPASNLSIYIRNIIFHWNCRKLNISRILKT